MKRRKKCHIIFNFHVACILFRFRSEVQRRIQCNECTNAIDNDFATRNDDGAHSLRSQSNAPFTFCQMLCTTTGETENGEACVGVWDVLGFMFFHSIVFHSTECIHSIIFAPYTQIYVYLRDILMPRRGRVLSTQPHHRSLHQKTATTPNDDYDRNEWRKKRFFVQIAVFSSSIFFPSSVNQPSAFWTISIHNACLTTYDDITVNRQHFADEKRRN